jgi:hypothetical protein
VARRLRALRSASRCSVRSRLETERGLTRPCYSRRGGNDRTTSHPRDRPLRPAASGGGRVWRADQRSAQPPVRGHATHPDEDDVHLRFGGGVIFRLRTSGFIVSGSARDIPREVPLSRGLYGHLPVPASRLRV